MRMLLRLLPLLVVLGVVAPPAAAQVECQDMNGLQISGCISTDGPWVSAPPRTGDNQYAGVWEVDCQPNQALVGTDWTTPSFLQLGDLLVYIQQFGAQRLFGDAPGALFLAVNPKTAARSFMPSIGCLPSSATAGARAAGFRAPRTFTHNLRPGREATHRHRCRRGERLVHSTTGVGFFKEQPPSARELRDVEVDHRQRRGRAIVTVTTGRRAGDNERVALQIHVTCRR